MNIFLLHPNPRESVKGYVDQHVSKITLEATQIADMGLRDLGLEKLTIYDPSHGSHPWVKFAGESLSNWLFVYRYIEALGWEFHRRRDRHHRSYLDAVENWGRFAAKLAEITDETEVGPLPQAMPEKYKRDDPIAAYRDYYRTEKLTQAWATSSREPPHWL